MEEPTSLAQQTSHLRKFDQPNFKNATYRLDRPSMYLINRAKKDELTGYDKLKNSMTSATVYIGHLVLSTTEEQIYELFSQCGKIKRVIMGLNAHDQSPTGFCFVIFKNAKGALNAVKYLNKTKINGKMIEIDLDPGFEDGRQYGRGENGGQKHQSQYGYNNNNGYHNRRGGYRGRGRGRGRGGRGGGFRGGRNRDQYQANQGYQGYQGQYASQYQGKYEVPGVVDQYMGSNSGPGTGTDLFNDNGGEQYRRDPYGNRYQPSQYQSQYSGGYQGNPNGYDASQQQQQDLPPHQSQQDQYGGYSGGYNGSYNGGYNNNNNGYDSYNNNGGNYGNNY